jgi:hypothetical protein
MESTSGPHHGHAHGEAELGFLAAVALGLGLERLVSSVFMSVRSAS